MAELRAFRLPDDLDWTRAVLWEALQIHDGDGPQQRAFKIALAALGCRPGGDFAKARHRRVAGQVADLGHPQPPSDRKAPEI